MVIYSERLIPGFGLQLALLLLLPLGFGMLAPIDITWGVINAVAVYAAGVCWMTLGAPRLIVTESTFRAGRASISRDFLSAVTTVPREGRHEALADARAWKLLRAWIPTGVRVNVNDPADPTPYWYVSTRHPEALVAALTND